MARVIHPYMDGVGNVYCAIHSTVDATPFDDSDVLPVVCVRCGKVFETHIETLADFIQKFK